MLHKNENSGTLLVNSHRQISGQTPRKDDNSGTLPVNSHRQISGPTPRKDDNSGTLLVNSHRQISGLTPRLLTIWNLPEVIVRSMSDKLALQFVAEQFDNPKGFLKDMTEIYEQTQLEIHEKAQLRDGRIIERYSKPLWVNEAYAGRLWIFKLNY